jgi:hypothetical protein
MPTSNTSANRILQAELKGVDPSYRAGATNYLALISAISPDLANPLATELTYTGYARIAVTKATFWTDNGRSFVNAVLAQFGKRTDGGATQTARWFAVVDTVSGAVTQAILGELDDPLDINLNGQPQFSPGELEVVAPAV